MSVFQRMLRNMLSMGGRQCLLLNDKDGLVVCDCFRPVTGGVACWVDTWFYFCCLCAHVLILCKLKYLFFFDILNAQFCEF